MGADCYGATCNKKSVEKSHCELVHTPEQCDVKLLGTIVHIYRKEHTLLLKSAAKPNRE